MASFEFNSAALFGNGAGRSHHRTPRMPHTNPSYKSTTLMSSFRRGKCHHVVMPLQREKEN
ncbi:hypothetical protein COLO4_20096 [Corchorus olitorius]|uniref:Uncharacterized protein n=1 Tax=Corchorus olitorius TaxID=93759 RepID=A0A1R3J1M4_9ROSI|nr:hypothetical protein COLO4_20096 [Corchorus olitorius]